MLSGSRLPPPTFLMHVHVPAGVTAMMRLATENAFKRTVAKIRLRVLSPAMVSLLSDTPPPAPPGPGALLAGFSPSESLAVQQYCKERRQLQDQVPGRPGSPGNVTPLRGDQAKLKPLLDRRKSRNRRNHLPEY